MNVSVIITTYNQPRWLERVLWAYHFQTHRQFQIVIADDGSDESTRLIIEQLRASTGLDIQHIWQSDQGFRKCSILNKAIVSSKHAYLVFSDGDCLPRRDFLAEHVRLAEKGRFLSGGIVHLPSATSNAIDREAIESGRATEWRYLRHAGLPRNRKALLLTPSPRVAAFLDGITTTRPTFNGHNASAWKSDLVSINGFDEEMQYGGLDRELGERLTNAGIRGKQIRHRAVAVHLYHTRDYANAAGWNRNNQIREVTRCTRRTWTKLGLDQYSTFPTQINGDGSNSQSKTDHLSKKSA